MSASKLIIRDYSNNRLKDGSCIIYLRYTYEGKVTHFSTGENIEPKHWCARTAMVKKTYKGYLHLNEYLQDYKAKVDSIIRAAKLSDDPADLPTIEYVKRKYQEIQDRKKQHLKNHVNFFEFIDLFVKECDGRKSPKTIKSYNSMRGYLKAYEKDRGVKLDWQSFDLSFYYDFQKFFVDKGYANNTFGSAIKNLKVILNEGADRKINLYDAYKSKKFVSVSNPSDNIYLTEDEINVLAKLDLSKNLKLDRVRDLFVLACCTGLRYSDFSRLKAENFEPKLLKIKTSKTKTDVVIPLHPHIVAIREKYKDAEGGLPKPASNQKMNEYLKDLCKLAGFKRTMQINTYKGSKVTTETKEAWELVATHTARRSFATNLFKQGFPTISIMKITGHSTDKAFMKYIKVGLEENANTLQTHWDKVYGDQKQVA